MNCRQEEVCSLQERKSGQKLRYSLSWTPGITRGRGQRGKGGAWGRRQRFPEGSLGKAGDPSTWKAGAEQKPTQVFVGKGWVSALVLTRSWAFRNNSCRWKSCVLCPGGCRLLGILLFSFFKGNPLITTQLSFVSTKIIKSESLGKVSTATSCSCLIQVDFLR